MILIPIQSPDHKEDALVIILDATNIDRMNVADHAEILLRECGRNLVNPAILLCYEEPTPKMMGFVNSRDVKGLIKYLRRGFEFCPEKGDHDNGPRKIGDMQ